MYHYVRTFDKSYPNFRHLNVDNFKSQLDYFEKKFGFVSRSEFDEAIKNKNLNNLTSKVVLTFDDAMKCHYDVVFKLLKERGSWGIFYVPTKPFQDGEILDVHKIHLLCGRFNGKKLLNFASSIIDNDMLDHSKISMFDEKTYKKQINIDEIANFKRLINYHLKLECREGILDRICQKFEIERLAKNFYISQKNIQSMHSQGMWMGSHGKSHIVMSKANLKDQKIEIEGSFEFLESLISLELKTYCHPYGGSHNFNKNTLNLLNLSNVDFSFSVESRDIKLNDMKKNLQALPRFDCNEFPHGKVS